MYIFEICLKIACNKLEFPSDYLFFDGQFFHFTGQVVHFYLSRTYHLIM